MANRHFGKLADTWKHLSLAEILSLEQPRQYWESHAGSATYVLVDDPERRYGVLSFVVARRHEALVRSRYMAHLATVNTALAGPASYPGSPLLAMLERGLDCSYLLCDIDPASAANLKESATELGLGARTTVLVADGMAALHEALSCEETTVINGELRHGYVFEVPADGISTGVPLKGLGRYSHEAAAVDPRTGIVYLTEDDTPSGLYRFVPNVKGDLAAGGKLQMLGIGDSSYVTYEDASPKDYGRVGWVDIDNPDPSAEETSTVDEGIANGGAQFARLEGAWFFEGRLYFVSTSGGPAGAGQVFRYNPGNRKLKLTFSSPGPDVLDAPDNICVSPRGGIVLCEDGDGDQFLHGLTTRGNIFPLAENRVVLEGERGFSGDFTGSEWAGATFEPKHGGWLFVNIQSPGITFAITGPWARLGL